MTSFKYSNSRDYLQSLTTIVYLCAGIPMVFFTLIFLEKEYAEAVGMLEGNIWVIAIIGVIALKLLLYSIVQFSKEVKTYVNIDRLTDKLELYKKLQLRRALLVASSSLLCCLGLYLTQNHLFSAIYSAGVIYISIHNPTTHRIVKDLRLKENDKDIMIHFKDFDSEPMAQR